MACQNKDYLGTYVPKETANRLRVIAASENKTMSKLLNKAVDTYLSTLEGETK